MKETGFLQFGGDVSIEQFNFAGIGTTGGGVPGNSYPDVRTGVRAQIQHLKAYATDEPLNQTCVDNRYEYVKKASAPYVQWLGQKENPEGAGWATGENYGYDIAGMLQHLLFKRARLRRYGWTSGGGYDILRFLKEREILDKSAFDSYSSNS